MTDQNISIAFEIELLGKRYPIRCLEAEASILQKAAEYLNQSMLAVQESGKTINLERIAIISALNITRNLFESENEKEKLLNEVNHNITRLGEKMDCALNKTQQMELIYFTK